MKENVSKFVSAPIKLILLFMVAIIVSGCGTRIVSNVTVFHSIPEKTNVTKYAFSSPPPQANSLEYATYMGYIKQELSKHNYVLVPKSKASVLVKFAYSIDSGRTEVRSVPTYGQTGVSSSTTNTSGNSYGTLNSYGNTATYRGNSSYTSKTTHTPTYGVTGSRSVSGTVYTRKLWLTIVEKSTHKSIYEGRVSSEGSTGQIEQVIPYLVKSLFKEFPGPSGSSRKVTLAMEK